MQQVATGLKQSPKSQDNDGIVKVHFEYDDVVLYGWRRAAIEKAIEWGRFGAASECAIFAIGCPNDTREFWNLSHLLGNDRRIKDMMAHLKISYSMPIQRFSWPKIDHSQFPLLCVGSTMTGKTYTHILYIVTKIINAIPISKVNELVDDSKSFKLLAELPTNKQNGASNRLNWTPSEEVNQDEIDFDGAFGEQIEETNGAQVESNNDEQMIDVDQFISHPKYIIVSSSQQQVELLDRQFEQVKMGLPNAANVSTSRLKMMQPIVKTVSVHHNEEKLALKCNAAEVLIATPAALMKCVHLKYITLAKCEKLFFDDLDLTLQLHHLNAREIIKLYLENLMQFEARSGGENCENIKQHSILDACRLYMFSKKWTDLVKRVVAVFPQRTVIFGSLAEASLYANVRFEIEPCLEKGDKVQFKLKKLTDLLDHLSDNKSRIAIVCADDKEAVDLGEILKAKENQIELMTSSNHSTRQQQRNDHRKNKICVMTDQSIETLLDINPHISQMGSLIHYSMPKTSNILDQRFRLLHEKITEQHKDIRSIMFIEPDIDQKLAKDLFDLVSRSLVTQNSSKLALRDLVNDRQDSICWRWASTGVCRLERLTPGIRFGSYCNDKHYIKSEDDMTQLMDVPLLNGGQFKITITNIVSPTEFYFRFESYRDLNNKNWTTFDKISAAPMRVLQKELNKFRSAIKYGLPLNQMVPGRIYGIYFAQETRVDRIKLLEAPQIDIEDKQHSQYVNQYNRQVQVLCIDSGVKLCVTLGNIFKLPDKLTTEQWQPMAHRGFHLGYKPTDNEPNWLYKAKRHFYEQVCFENMIDCTVWLRHANGGCFWFEDMVVNRWLANLDNTEIVKTRPHKDLVRAGFAIEVTSEPAGIGPSLRSRIVSKWQLEEATKEACYAFLRRDRYNINIYVLEVSRGVDKKSLVLSVRNADYNKQLIELENDMLNDYKKDRLERLNYFEKDVYCLAKIASAVTDTAEGFDINRCKIVTVYPSDLNTAGEELYEVECLDHADRFKVRKTDLYLPLMEHIRRLPFQAINCKLADVDPAIVQDQTKFEQARELIFKYTRTVDNNLTTCICERNQKDNEQIDLLIAETPRMHVPLHHILQDNNEMQLFLN